MRAGGVPGAAQLWSGVPAEDGVIQGVVNDAYEAVVVISLQCPEGRAQDARSCGGSGKFLRTGEISNETRGQEPISIVRQENEESDWPIYVEVSTNLQDVCRVRDSGGFV